MLSIFNLKRFRFIIGILLVLPIFMSPLSASHAFESYIFQPASEIEQKTQKLTVTSTYVAPLRTFDIYVPKFMWPVSPEHYNEGFGIYRPETNSYHQGLDIMPGYGTTIVSATDGVVVKAESSGSLGTHVVIYDNGYYTIFYGHMIAGSIPPDIVPGATVKMGQPIGQVGSTGRSSAPHLHYEIHDGDSAVDPWTVMAKYSVN